MRRTGLWAWMATAATFLVIVGFAGTGATIEAGNERKELPEELNHDGRYLGGPDLDIARRADGDDDDDDDDSNGNGNGSGDANPIGAWFGIARPCTPPAVGVPVGSVDPRPDPTICEIACDGDCAPNAFPFLEVTMIPTLLADGTVLADDFAEVLDGHSTAQGKWVFKGKRKLDGKMVDEYRASFIWFNGPLPDFGLHQAFVGSARPRFVTFFDKDNPDEMRGYIQPYLYPYTDPSPDGIGLVRLQEGTGFPDPNPTDPLPEVCDPTDPTAKVPCLGTLHFFIRRIPAE